MVVYKYTLPPFSAAAIRMQRGARVLHIAGQRDRVCLWALVDPHAEMEERRFVVVGTGHEMPPGEPESFRHLGTVLLDGGALVFHVFEEDQG